MDIGNPLPGHPVGFILLDFQRLPRVWPAAGVNLAMNSPLPHHSETNSQSSPAAGGVTTRAETHSDHDTAQPSLTSGFGAVIEKERELRVATENSLRHVPGTNAEEIDRLLVHQHGRLGANIALLEQRYESLPQPQRFVHWHGGASSAEAEPSDQAGASDRLPALIARHTVLQADIDALIACDPDGQRGELILNEIRRHHAEMAGALSAVLSGELTAPSQATKVPVDASGVTYRAQERWDNEGGPARPPAVG